MMIESRSCVFCDIMCCDDTVLLLSMWIIRIDESSTIERLRWIFEFTDDAILILLELHSTEY